MKNANTVNRSTIASVDRLGKLNAKIALLVQQAETIKTDLKKTGLSCIQGKVYKAVIIRTEFETVDNTKVKTLLECMGVDAPLKTVTRTTVSLYDL